MVALACLGLVLAPHGLGQTQPEVDVESVPVGEHVPPGEVTELPVNATVSCEGWGEAGDQAFAVYRFDPPGPEHRGRLAPAEVELPAGPGECQPGQRLDASTTLVLEPTRQVSAGAGVQTHFTVHLEERSSGDVVREHGPWSEAIAYTTGFWAEVEVRAQDEEIDLPWDGRRRTEVAVAVEANGRAALEVRAPSHEGIHVDVRPRTTLVEPGDPQVVSVTVEDTRSAPADERIQNVALNATVRAPWDRHNGPPKATATTSLAIRQAAWHETGQALGLGGVLVAGLGLAALAYSQRRRGARRGDPREAPPPVPAQPAALAERPGSQEAGVRQATTAWLAALGVVGLAWGTAQGPVLLAAGALSCLAAAWLATGGRLPEPVRERLARADPDRVGGGLIAGGLAALALAVAATVSAGVSVVALLLVGGAWALTRRRLPCWTGPAVLSAGVLAALAPMLSAGLTIGATGALVRVPLGGPIAFALGLWLPFLLAFGVLSARCRGGARAAALAGVSLVLLHVLVPGALVEHRMDLGFAVVQGEVLVVAMLTASALPGVLALVRRS